MSIITSGKKICNGKGERDDDCRIVRGARSVTKEFLLGITNLTGGFECVSRDGANLLGGKAMKILKKERKRAPREWFADWITEDWWPVNYGEKLHEKKKKKVKKNKSRERTQRSIDWFSGELFRGSGEEKDLGGRLRAEGR
ncbi:hypothetical protein LINGRAHAP2_LOCUS7214 [Linum grandiflorum]